MPGQQNLLDSFYRTIIDSDDPRYERENIFKSWDSCEVGESVEFEVVHVSKDGAETPVEIKGCAGSQFDPVLAENFYELMEYT